MRANQTLKNQTLLENYFVQEDLDAAIAAFVASTTTAAAARA